MEKKVRERQEKLEEKFGIICKELNTYFATRLQIKTGAELCQAHNKLIYLMIECLKVISTLNQC